MEIRRAAQGDKEAIIALYLEAFGEDEAGMVSDLAIELLSETNTLSFVSEVERVIVGHVAFSPMWIEGNKVFSSFILAPLAVHPAQQKMGIGSGLVEHGMDHLRQRETSIVFVYGDPGYYSRFGFERASAERFEPPYELSQPIGWQALWLNNKESTSGKLSCVKALQKAELW